MAVGVNKLITSVGYLTARENEVELFTTKFYDLHIVSVKKVSSENGLPQNRGSSAEICSDSNDSNKIIIIADTCAASETFSEILFPVVIRII